MPFLEDINSSLQQINEIKEVLSVLYSFAGPGVSIGEFLTGKLGAKKEKKSSGPSAVDGESIIRSLGPAAVKKYRVNYDNLKRFPEFLKSYLHALGVEQVVVDSIVSRVLDFIEKYEQAINHLIANNNNLKKDEKEEANTDLANKFYALRDLIGYVQTEIDKITEELIVKACAAIESSPRLIINEIIRSSGPLCLHDSATGAVPTIAAAAATAVPTIAAAAAAAAATAVPTIAPAAAAAAAAADDVSEESLVTQLFIRQEAKRHEAPSRKLKKIDSPLMHFLKEFSTIINKLRDMQRQPNREFPVWMKHFLTTTSFESLLENCCFRNLSFSMDTKKFSGESDITPEVAYSRYFSPPSAEERAFIKRCLVFFIQAFSERATRGEAFDTCLSFVVAGNPSSVDRKYILFLPETRKTQELIADFERMTQLIFDREQVQVDIVYPSVSGSRSKQDFTGFVELLVHDTEGRECAEVSWMKFLMKLKAFYGPSFDKIEFRGLNIHVQNEIFSDRVQRERDMGALDRNFVVTVDDSRYVIDEYLPCHICCRRAGLMTSIKASSEHVLSEGEKRPLSPVLANGNSVTMREVSHVFAPIVRDVPAGEGPVNFPRLPPRVPGDGGTASSST